LASHDETAPADLAARARECLGQGACAQAVELLGLALADRPKDATLHGDLARALLMSKRPEEALESADRAIALNPGFATAHNQRGNALRALGRTAEAIASFERAIKARPDYADAHNNRGVALAALGRVEAAETSYRRALAAQPGYAQAMNNLANALVDQGRLEEAEPLYGKALSLQPLYADAQYNLGVLYERQGRFEDAKAAYRKVLADHPGFVHGEYNLGLLQLTDGDLKAGFAGYEKRLDVPGLGIQSPARVGSRWDGTPLEGRRILLHTEQGFGDSFQFIRFARLVAEDYGGEVIVQCQPKVKAVLATVPGLKTVVAEDEEVPDFDTWAPLMSLPHILGLTADTVPWDGPYIQAALLPRPTELSGVPGLKVGILWSGNPEYKIDETRSIDLSAFAPLVAVPGTRFYALQYGERAGDIKAVRFGNDVEDLSPYLDGFANTAALVDQLDLVITVDTYLVHLAGAMGKPTWLLLSHTPDWRWMRDRPDTPWYPDMRLLRQPPQVQTTPGDWRAVFAAAARDLAELAQAQ
jgi:tetratricopeptide (TPR) repeat protein